MKQNNWYKEKNIKPITNKVNILIVLIFIIQLGASLISFFSYKDNDNLIYYNQKRLICAEKLNEITINFSKHNFTSWKYPYVVIDNKGKVLYKDKTLNLGEYVDLNSFIHFDRSFSKTYEGYEKSSFPIVIDSENRGFFIAFINSEDLSIKPLNYRRLEAVLPNIVGIVITIIVLIIYKLYLKKNIIKPILKITESSEDIIKGKLDNYITFNSNNEIGELSYAFELMRDELNIHRKREEALKRSQKEIIAAISHDLKTPLSSIRAYSEAIKDGIAETEEERKEYSEIILNKVNNLNKLIDDLLEHSKADLDMLTINKKEIFIKGFIDNIVREISLDLEALNVEFKYENKVIDGIINIDEIRLNQVIFNLISNALKYSKENKIIEFQAEVKDKKLFIYLKDNGEGIPSEDIPYIFNKFYRGDKSRNSKVEGSGLGLSICKYIIEKHYGEIFYKSNKGVGSIFYFYIPLI